MQQKEPDDGNELKEKLADNLPLHISDTEKKTTLVEERQQ